MKRHELKTWPDSFGAVRRGTKKFELRLRHELKTWPDSFEAIRRRSKKFELRLDDRSFEVGDLLVLKEWDPSTGYSGRELDRFVTYKLSAGTYPGLLDGYCVLGLGVTDEELEELTERLDQLEAKP